MRVIAGYSAMMALSLTWGLILHFHGQLGAVEAEVGTAVVECLDTIILVGTAVAIGRLRVPTPDWRVRAAAYLTAPLALAFVLAVNVGYRRALTAFLRPTWLHGPVIQPEWSAVSLLLFAVQPALVEEWFFRHLALGALRTVTGVHAAVWASAAMFAAAHVYNPFGLPWLLVAGVVFGYWRVASGGLSLPILLHFAHNAAVIWVQGFV